jgi:parallel beta-helix repeat protein
LSVYPRKYPPMFQPIDWNTMVDRVKNMPAIPGDYNFKNGADYAVWTDNTYFYANDQYHTVFGGATDAGGVNGGNFAAVMQACIGDLDQGGKITIDSGYYPDTEQINVDNDNLTFVGAGASTIIYTATNIFIFNVTGNHTLFQNILFKTGLDPEVQTTNRAIYGDTCDDIKIFDCGITSDSDATAFRIGIDFLNCTNVDVKGLVSVQGANNVLAGRGCTNLKFHDNIISSPTDNTIDVGGSHLFIKDNIIYKTTFTGWSGHTQSLTGIFIAAGSSYIEVSGNDIYEVGASGIQVNDNCFDIRIHDNTVKGCGYLDNGYPSIQSLGALGTENYKINISNNNVVNGGYYGISLTHSSIGTVNNNTCLNNGQVDSAHGEGIRLEDVSSYLTVSGNTCTDNQTPKTQTYGITNVGGSNFNQIFGNNLAGNKLGNVFYSGNADGNVSDNLPLPTATRTEWGTGYVVNDAGSVPHTLGVTPTYVLVCASEPHYYTSVGTIDSTTISVHMHHRNNGTGILEDAVGTHYLWYYIAT